MELTRDLARLPIDQAAAALETSATIAGVSLRASIEFLRAAPEAAQTLGASELRAWGEMGRRLAMADVETAITFFVAGVNDLRAVPQAARALVFQLCSRQMTLSASIATETLRKVGALAQAIDNPDVLRSVLEIAAEISRRSAKHSADFLAATPQVIDCLDSLHRPGCVEQSHCSSLRFCSPGRRYRRGRVGGNSHSARKSRPRRRPTTAGSNN